VKIQRAIEIEHKNLDKRYLKDSKYHKKLRKVFVEKKQYNIKFKFMEK